MRNGKDDTYTEHLSNISDRLAIAKSWLDECLATHKACGSSATELPSRLLDISKDPIRVIERPQVDKFAAFSYCWGKVGNLKTVTANLKAHIEGIPPEVLPRTIADAVTICRALGLEYLWVDALCILQDDRDDWASQIPLMSSIYSGATVTISAQAAGSVQDGCLDFSKSTNAPLARFEQEVQVDGVTRTVKLSIQEENGGYYNSVPGHHSSRPSVDSDELLPLSTRAWGFQERFLSSRILFCTASELSWQCSEHKRCECDTRPTTAIPNMYGGYLDSGQLAPIVQLEHKERSDQYKKLGLWFEVVRQYSGRQLSMWTDRLPGFQGVVRAFCEGFPSDFALTDHLSGMWCSSLERCLSWHRNVLHEGFPEAASPLASYAPSWSWIGCPGPVDYYSSSHDPESVALLKIVEINPKYSSDLGSFGSNTGSLTVSGHLIPVRRDIQTYLPGVYFRFPEGFEDGGDSFFDVPNLDMEIDDPFDGGAADSVTHFLPLIRAAGRPVTQGIFLAPVTQDGGEEVVFRRVGYAYDYNCTIPWLEVDLDPYLRTIKLI